MEKKIIEVAEYWGDRMPMMCMEEAAELIQAISKLERFRDNVFVGIPKEAKKPLIDEIGDMYISINAIMYYYGISQEDINKRVEYKLNKKYENPNS